MQFIESYTTELKEVVTPELKKEIIAFANADGGEIYIGISKDGVVVGVSDVEREMERISNMIRDGIKPDLTGFTAVSLAREGDCNLIKIVVSRGSKRPYHLSDQGLKPSGVYIRHGITSAPVSEEMIRQMIKDSDGTTFDKSRSIHQELTFQYASQYFKDSKIPVEENNHRTLGLIDEDGYFTNAALLISDQCEHSIKCAVFRGIGKANFQARNEFTGSILKQMDEAYHFVSLLNNQNSSIVNLKREDHPDYPDDAIREALLNSLIHRDYDYSGSILVNVFDDRIEFVSIGGLVKGLTLLDIMGGVSQTRNVAIANIFYRLKLAESYGTGIRRILENYTGSRKLPVFSPAPASFVTTLPNRNYRLPEEISDSISTEDRVIRLLESQKIITRKDVEKLLGCSSFPAMKILNALLEAQKIVKVGAARSTKYRLRP